MATGALCRRLVDRINFWLEGLPASDATKKLRTQPKEISGADLLREMIGFALEQLMTMREQAMALAR